MIMKLFVLVGALSGLVTLTNGSCTSSDSPCQVGSGKCSEAVQLGIGGDLVGAVDRAFYGKYCGSLNKCQVVKGAKGSKSKGNSRGSSSSEEDSAGDEATVCEIKTKNSSKSHEGIKSHKASKKSSKKGSADSEDDDEPCPAVPCDVIDESCSDHDACLDAQLLLTPPPEGKKLPVPERCPCDVNLIYEMVLEGAATDPTGLCDDAFYNELVPNLPTGIEATAVQLLGHEAHFVAAPFCCNIMEDTDGDGEEECSADERTDSAKFKVALLFCDQLVGKFAALGVAVCS